MCCLVVVCCVLFVSGSLGCALSDGGRLSLFVVRCLLRVGCVLFVVCWCLCVVCCLAC